MIDRDRVRNRVGEKRVNHACEVAALVARGELGPSPPRERRPPRGDRLRCVEMAQGLEHSSQVGLLVPNGLNREHEGVDVEQEQEVDVLIERRHELVGLIRLEHEP
jgi:hypothetical protein